jgi:hypothetical protein
MPKQYSMGGRVGPGEGSRERGARAAVHARAPWRCALAMQNMQLRFSGKCRPDQSGFMPANLSTLAHFSISRAIMLANSAGELPVVA